MDWGDSSELQDIFKAEVTDRSARLIEGAQTLIDGNFKLNPSQDLARDAHTIKGSARVMGFEFAAEGARLLEEIWKALETGGIRSDNVLGERLLAVASAMPVAVESGGSTDIARLQQAVVALSRHVHTTDQDPSGGMATPKTLKQDSDSREGHVDRSSRDDLSRIHEMEVDLGGLLPSLHDRLASGSTRVESPKLYQLINRAVEARLDARALLGQLKQTLTELQAGEDVVSALGGWQHTVEALDRALEDVEQQALELSSIRLKELSGTFPQLVRFVARRTGKEIRFELVGDDLEVDRQILERLHEPLRHLLVNAIDHGIEPPDERQRSGKPSTGTVALRASSFDHQASHRRGGRWSRHRLGQGCSAGSRRRFDHRGAAGGSLRAISSALSLWLFDRPQRE